MVKKILLSGFLLWAFMPATGWSQSTISGFSDFKEPLGIWVEAGNAKLNPDDEKKLTALAGTGVFVNEQGKSVNLITKQTYGDIELKLDFMVSKRSNSGVYLQGRYEVQIFDSWGKGKPGSADCGGIYARYDGKKTYEGIPPLVNASKEPGEWQHLFIRFNAPRFNSKGVKTKNALFKEVKLNGITVHRKVEVTGPTASSLDNREEPSGPLMLQGDHWPVAFRNIRIKKR